MVESITIVRRCLKKMPKGEIDAKIKDVPPGEGIGHHEAPRGEVFHYVRSDGSNSPVRHKVRHSKNPWSVILLPMRRLYWRQSTRAIAVPNG